MRAFLHQGERQEVGTVIEVGDGLGIELIFNGRADHAGTAPAAAPGPMTTASAHQLGDGPKVKSKGKKNA